MEQTHQEEVNKLEAVVQNTKKVMKDLKCDYAENTKNLKEEIQQLQDQIQAQTNEVEKDKHLNDITEELTEIKSQLHKEVAAKAQMQQQCQKDAEDLEETLRRAKAEVHQLKDDKAEMGQDHRSKTQQLENEHAKIVKDLQDKTEQLQLPNPYLPKNDYVASTKNLNILTGNNENLMKQLNLVLDHPSSSSSPSASMLQAEIEHLKLKLAAEQMEKDSLKQNISNYRSKLEELKKSKFSSQSPEPEPTVARAYTTIRSSRKVLSRVKVEGPLREAYQKYSLKGAIEDKASEADSEVEEDTSVTPIIGRRLKKSCPAHFSIKIKPSTDKGKQRAPNTTDSSDSEDVVSANDVESDTSRIQELKKAEGMLTGVDH
ncbi:hypothetical protein GYMLUDRAFT_253210 [Collybiopsis luxurians FD-317 M1]|uniref:Uncharacterized protein n=1 Tax=Collybiopsis luxurians FD-317 M1 TaxID=944289 RepID=A0A0D0BL41_9AGAR|nr:hypothetical protein GYMLUDRAFT_253210 [Collybiopsis luxurians FD-317 M1]